MARLFARYPDALARTLGDRRRAAASRSTSCATNTRTSRCRPARRPTSTWRPHLAGRGLALSRGRSGQPARDARKRAAADRELDYAHYFLTVHDIVALRARAGHPVPGPRLGGQFRGLLLPRRHRGRSRRDRPAVRALHLRRSARAARHRRRFRARAARGGDPVRLPTLRPRPRRHRRHGDPLPAAQRDPRGRQGAGPHRGRRPPRSPAQSGAGATSCGRTSTSPRSGSIPTSPVIRRAVALARELIGFPRHLSQHVGGFVLTRGRLDETVPIGNAAMDDRTFIEWDKDDIDALGIMKVDVLALGMLTCIRKALRPAAPASTADLDLADIPHEDPAVYDMLSRGRLRRRVPGREPGADDHAAAAEAARVLRPGDRGGDRPARPDPGRHGASLSAPPAGARSRSTSPRPRPSTASRTSWSACSARRSACRCSRSRRCASPSRRRSSRRTRPTGCAAPWPPSATTAPSTASSSKMVDGMVARGYERGLRRALLQADRGLRHLRLSRRATRASFAHAGLRLGLAEMPSPGASSPAPLLNSQPMGFYAPAQLVRDAREHGVECAASTSTPATGTARSRHGCDAAAGPAPDRRLPRGLGGAADAGPRPQPAACGLPRSLVPGRPAEAGAGGAGGRRRDARPGARPARQPLAGARAARRGGPAAVRRAAGDGARGAASGDGEGRARDRRLPDDRPVAEGAPAGLPAQPASHARAC